MTELQALLPQWLEGFVPPPGLVLRGAPLAAAYAAGAAFAGWLRVRKDVRAPSSHGLDNLTVQVAAAWIAWLVLA